MEKVLEFRQSNVWLRNVEIIKWYYTAIHFYIYMAFFLKFHF